MVRLSSLFKTFQNNMRLILEFFIAITQVTSIFLGFGGYVEPFENLFWSYPYLCIFSGWFILMLISFPVKIRFLIFVGKIFECSTPDEFFNYVVTIISKSNQIRAFLVYNNNVFVLSHLSTEPL